MTAINPPNPSEEGRRPDRDPEASSLRAETISNRDLYCETTPPAYELSAAENEVSLDAEAMEAEKVSAANASVVPSDTPRSDDNERNDPAPRANPEQEEPEAPVTGSAPAVSSVPVHPPEELPPVYIQQLTKGVAIASIKKCEILPNRPAVWLVKRKGFALSPLVATVLLKEGIIRSKDLELISTSAGVKRDPNDPLSGIAFATYDTVSDIIIGLVEGPVEAARQMSPVLQKYEQKRRDERPTISYNTPHESSPLVRESSAHETTQVQSISPSSKLGQDDKADSPSSAPNIAKEVAKSTGKGLGRIVGASLKAPMTFTHGITRGFHNMPKLYGDEPRQYENVVDLRSGIETSAKSFGHGVSDGLKDFFVQPVLGAQKEGGIGFVKGVGKGIGNLVCKPSAGIFGLVGYSSVGVYKSLQGLNPRAKSGLVAVFREHGEMEYNEAPEQTRLEVVRRWCQLTMKQSMQA